MRQVPVPRTPNLARWRLLRRLAAWVTLALVVATTGLVLTGRAYTGRHVFIAQYESPLAFTAVAGDRIVLGVRTAGGVSDYCAAEGGVQLWLSDDSDVLPVVPGRPPLWGSTIRSTSGDDESGCFLAGVFEVPRTSVEGTLKGDITYPAPYAGGFTNETRPLEVPVRITVVPGHPVWGGRPVLAVAHWVCIALAAVMLGCGWSLLVLAFRWPAQGWRPRRTLPGWLGILLGAAIFGGVTVFGTMAAVLAGDAHAGSAHLPMTAPSFLFPVLMGAAAAAFGARAALWVQDP
jgi:hypothetical protein